MCTNLKTTAAIKVSDLLRKRSASIILLIIIVNNPNNLDSYYNLFNFVGLHLQPLLLKRTASGSMMHTH